MPSSLQTTSPPRRGCCCGPDPVATRNARNDRAALQADDTVAIGSRPGHALLADHDGRAALACEPPHEFEQRARAALVELGRGLVEEEQSGLERERRREAHALQLAAGELRDVAAGEVGGADGLECRPRARLDLDGRRPGILDAERDFGEHAAEHDLVLRILKQRRHRPRELGGSRPPRVVAAHLDRACELPAVKVRHEPGQRADERCLPTSRPAGQEHDLPRRDVHRDSGQRRAIGAAVREREVAYRR